MLYEIEKALNGASKTTILKLKAQSVKPLDISEVSYV
jgi:hypothetical protein